MSKEKEAWLTGISRGTGGDSAMYETRGDVQDKIVVSVSWALLSEYSTTVIINGKEAAEFTDNRYVQPPEALSRLGYIVHGLVDFAEIKDD